MASVDDLYKRAEAAFNKRNYDYSIELFSQILLLDPNNTAARKALRATVLQKYREGGAPGKIKIAMLWGKVKAQLAAAKGNAQKSGAPEKIPLRPAPVHPR